MHLDQHELYPCYYDETQLRTHSYIGNRWTNCSTHVKHTASPRQRSIERSLLTSRSTSLAEFI